ncbi:DUF4256 domain-containing protein [Flavobacterium sp.]|uniref:DUF4256 domain-containing protein n=1 Tax=Flavobacterium sp. TaxID=239 RepID=UPI002603E7D5|nr:DUF4256 domain-containing protein [Flavobacterium sp.]
MNKKLSPEDQTDLLQRLKTRFENNMPRHPDMEWDAVKTKLVAQPDKLWSLNEMERTDGEPDVIAFDKSTGAYHFCDCATESPKGRRSLCYDRKALDSRKENKPKDNVVDVAASMGIKMLTEEQYRELQALGAFDLKTSSWIQTPNEIRSLGGALFCDRRYNHVFVYHNGAESYYASRAFRGILTV